MYLHGASYDLEIQKEYKKEFKECKCLLKNCFSSVDHTIVKREKISEEAVLKCNCNEEPYKLQHWSWTANNRAVVLSKGNREVLFHPIYSSGTASIIGTQKFRPNMHYYWEIKILTYLYGTDVMFGVGTPRMEQIQNIRYQFVTLLGATHDSWGLSYHGEILNDGLAWCYTRTFTLGSIVGVHVDMCSGTLEFFINGTPLGQAFDNLRKNDYDLYPMITSTAAKSAMRMTCSMEFAPSLQYECLNVIRRHPHLVKQLDNIKGLKKMYSRNLYWLLAPLNNIREGKCKSCRRMHLYRDPENSLPVEYMD